MCGLCVATRWTFPKCLLLTTNMSEAGGASTGVVPVAASQSTKQCIGCDAIGWFASKSREDLICAKIAASSALALANAVCTEASCASR